MNYYCLLSTIIVLFSSVTPLFPQDSNDSPVEIKKISNGCMPPTAISQLDINNVRTKIFNNGLLWLDPDEWDASYEVPKGSGKHSLAAGGILIGGYDDGGNLRVSSQFFGWGDDFFPGPLAMYGVGQASTNPEICENYDRIYKIEKQEVKDFRNWFTADLRTRYEDYPDYVIPEILYNYPALGPEVDGFDYFLAPFIDYNGDNNYDPNDGDYPYYDLFNTSQSIAHRPSNVSQLYGDQTLWWVMNDKGNVQTHSPGAPALGIEIHAQAFAFASDDRLNDMTFYNYQIINRSTYTINETYFGVFAESQLGNPENNYIGCDVGRGLGYFYNSTREDGNKPEEYGKHPPAIGLDFLGGPYQDPDGSDYGESGEPNGCDESLNGVNFNDGIIDNERLGLSYFMRVAQDGNYSHTWWPYSAQSMYNYLHGYWIDGYPLIYGNSGHELDPGDLVPNVYIQSRFMYPGTSDPCFWNTNGYEMPLWDEPSNPRNFLLSPRRQFIASVGPFTLEPGAINDVSFGMIWARSYLGYNMSSVSEMKKADDAAQALFENNFQSLEGPNAPELEIIEMENELLVHIWNSDKSNNYIEQYSKIDPTILASDELLEDLEEAIEDNNPIKILDAQKAIDDYRSFKFQGYQIYQLADNSVTVNDLDNPDLARLAFQCDLKDKISTIINYYWDSDLKAYIPQEMVSGANEGITHTFTITKDQFRNSGYGLVNNKEYYFMAVAYAYNNYINFDQLDPYASYYGQRKPYLKSNSATRGPVKVYMAIPHNPSINNFGTSPNAEFGEGPVITQHDGHGNGLNWLELSQETIDEIMSGYPWYKSPLTFEQGYSPVQVKIVDPLNINGGDYIIKFEPDSVKKEYNHYNQTDITNTNYYGLVLDTKWKLLKSSPGLDLYNDTIHADAFIRTPNEQLFLNDGISITINQSDFPGARDNKFYEIQTTNLGFQGATLEYEDEYVRWLDFIQDEEGNSPENWIRSGERFHYYYRDYNDYRGLDNNEVFETILDGTWAPYFLTSKYIDGPMFHGSQPYLQDLKVYRLSSVNIVFTNDTTKWTRSAVIELSDNSAYAEGLAEKFDLRTGASIDKLGNPDNTGTGMSWFPGYAIDIETGVRLNIVFGEASELPHKNARDMMWNPTSQVYDDTIPDWAVFGGKHYVYIFGHNEGYASNQFPVYDSCRTFYNIISEANSAEKMQLFMHAMWVSIPIVNPDYAFDNPLDIPDEDITIKLRVSNPYFRDIGVLAQEAPNQNYPMYSFSTTEYAVDNQVLEVARKALDLINVVPNPYYGFSEYETHQLDSYIRFTNLPQKCTISIYQSNGSLVRRIEKDNTMPYMEWDLTNRYKVKISGGIYIIHVKAPGIGEKTLKWFGAIRPIDLQGY